MKPISGYIGSALVHGSLVAIAVFCARLVPRAFEPPEAPGPVIDVVPSPGPSDDSPGGPGTVSAPKTPSPRFVPVNNINADDLLADYRHNHPPVTPPASPTPGAPADNAKPVPPRPVRNAPVRNPVAKPLRNNPGVSQITGAQISTTTVAPVNGGPGKPGNPGGNPNSVSPAGGNATVSLRNAVESAFAAVYVPMFREKGRELAGTRDTCKVRLLVSPSGNVTFGEWLVRPAEALLERIVRESVDGMRPVPPPPAGEATAVVVTVTGVVE